MSSEKTPQAGGKQAVTCIEDVRKAREDWLFETFWKPIICNEDGSINMEQLKKELADFSYVMQEVPKVYCHITGDRLSKILYKAETVILAADRHYEDMYSGEGEK